MERVCKEAAPNEVLGVQDGVHGLRPGEEGLTRVRERYAVSSSGVPGINDVRFGESDVVVEEHLDDCGVPGVHDEGLAGPGVLAARLPEVVEVPNGDCAAARLPVAAHPSLPCTHTPHTIHRVYKYSWKSMWYCSG